MLGFSGILKLQNSRYAETLPCCFIISAFFVLIVYCAMFCRVSGLAATRIVPSKGAIPQPSWISCWKTTPEI
jgi:hypothetical protein